MFYLNFRNASTVVSNDDLQAFLEDFQSQVSNEFVQAWGVDANVMTGAGWPITITDYPGPNDPPFALGYHSLDQYYTPYGVVFARLALDYGFTWTSVASHEGLETLADPLIDSTIFIDTSNGQGTSGFLVAQEVCDAPENLAYPGAINGTELSDFVYPQWFFPGYVGKVDYLGQVPGPLQLLSGGYISYDPIIQAGGWQEADANKIKGAVQGMKQRPKSVHYLPQELIPQGSIPVS